MDFIPNVFEKTIKRSNKCKPIIVNKHLGLQCVLSSLLVVDSNDLNMKHLSGNQNDYLLNLTQDNVQFLANELWKSPKKSKVKTNQNIKLQGVRKLGFKRVSMADKRFRTKYISKNKLQVRNAVKLQKVKLHNSGKPTFKENGISANRKRKLVPQPNVDVITVPNKRAKLNVKRTKKKC